MSHPTSPARALLTGAATTALFVSTLLTAAPAGAATVSGAPESPEFGYLVPASAPTTVEFRYSIGDGPGGTTPTFPAGTYWVTVITSTSTFPFWIDGLSEQYETPGSSWRQVTLDAPGPITQTVTDTGLPDTLTSVALYEMPPGTPDLTTLSEDERYAHLNLDGEEAMLPTDAALVVAADVPAPAIAPLNADITTADDLVLGDFLGLGTDLPATRVGNAFTVYGPNGQNRSFTFGRAGDTVLVGDWDGDGVESLGLRRGNLLLLDDDLDGGHAAHTYTFGRTEDDVLVGDWDGDGTDTVALRRGTQVFARNDFTSGAAPITFDFGRASDVAVVGDWDQDGDDSIAVQRGDRIFVKNTLTGGDADSVHSFFYGE